LKEDVGNWFTAVCLIYFLKKHTLLSMKTSLFNEQNTEENRM